MKTFTLKNKIPDKCHTGCERLIDHYMVQANGEFVKVYLFLLRHLDNAGSSLTVFCSCRLSEQHRKWYPARIQILGIQRTSSDGMWCRGHVCELELIQIPQTQAQIPITAAKKPSASVVSVKPATPKAVAASVSRPAAHADAAKAQKQLKSLLFIAEQYLGKTLTKTDMDAITYFYDHLACRLTWSNIWSNPAWKTATKVFIIFRRSLYPGRQRDHYQRAGKTAIPQL